MNKTRDSMIKLNGLTAIERSEPMEKSCPSCQIDKDAGAQYCSQCGRKVIISAVAPPKKDGKQETPLPSPPTPPTEIDTSTEVASVAPSSVPKQPLPSTIPESKGPLHLCRFCGQQLNPDYLYCPRCGTMFGQARSQYRLKSLRNGTEITAAELTDSELTIGKLDECNLVIANDEYVSRRHARLFKSDGIVFLEDMGSANGTYLRVRRPIVLEPGDEILIGTAVLQLEEFTRPC